MAFVIFSPYRLAVFARVTLAILLTSLALPAVSLTASPPSPAADPNPASSDSSDRVGLVNGSFRVNELGQATYSVPINAPSGVAGVTPQVSLNYNSGAGNGPVGLGWSIGGVSAIRRCRQTLHQDDGVAKPISWGSQDRFCLDGQRLVLDGTGVYGAPGTWYRTEIDQQVRVQSVGGTTGNPDYFIMESKDGSTSWFGWTGTANSEREALDDASVGTGKILKWGINRFVDSANNQMRYVYGDSLNGHLIQEIRYSYANTGSWLWDGQKSTIEFEYKTRTDEAASYVGGHKFRVKKLLDKITIKNDEVADSLAYDTIREYKLTYDAPGTGTGRAFNQLSQIEECSGTVCIKPTIFTWDSQAQDYALSDLVTTLTADGDAYGQHRFADVNGDGYQDILWVERDLANGGEDFDGHHWHYALFDQSLGKYGAKQTIYSFVDPNGGAFSGAPYYWEVLDYNLDGLVDVIIPKDGTWQIFLSTGTGYSSASLNVVNTGISASDGDGIQVLDVDSDGLGDLLYERNGGTYLRRLARSIVGGLWTTSITGEVDINTLLGAAPLTDPGLLFVDRYVVTKTGDSDNRFTGAPTGDFNGDGLMDIVVVQIEENPACQETRPIGCVTYSRMMLYTANLSGSALTFDYYAYIPGQNPILNDVLVRDVNGDGLSDLVMSDGPQVWGGGLVSWNTRINLGDGFSSSISLGVLPASGDKMRQIDIDGDGTLDTVYPNNGTIRYRLFDRVTQTYANELDSGLAIAGDESFQITDVTGDAVPDLIKASLTKLKLKVGSGDFDVIEEIDTGLGNVTEIDYAPMTDSGVYVKFNDANDQHWDLPLYSTTLGKSGNAIFDVVSSSPVVKSVSGSSPRAHQTIPGQVDINAKSMIYYIYKGAKIEAGGVGSLGFREVWSVDMQTDIWTFTEYRQDYPFVGRPLKTEVIKWTGGFNGTLVSSSSTYWAIRDWNSGNPTKPYHIFSAFDLESRFDLTTGSETSFVVSEKTLDDWGNVIATSVKTYDNFASQTLKSTVATDNVYADDSGLGLAYVRDMGRLSQSTVTHTRASKPPVTRKAKFEYYSSGNKKGLLKDEISNPDGGDQKLTITHTYDGYGNITRTTAVGDPDGSGPELSHSRYTKWEYESGGRRLVKTYENSGTTTLPPQSGGSPGDILVEEVLTRNQFGSPTEVEDTFGVATKIKYGKLGREYHRYIETGTWQTSYFYETATECPSGTQVRKTTTTAEGQTLSLCLDAAGREIRNTKLGFGATEVIYQDTEYDSSGRVKHHSVPYFSGSASNAIKWTSQSYDSLGRITSMTQPNGGVVNSTYAGLTTTVNNAEGQNKTETVNEMGELLEVKDHLNTTISYDYDSTGNLLLTKTEAAGATGSIDIQMEYDTYGRKKKTIDPDKGTWTYAYNAFGELIEQLDAKGQRTLMTYDVMGRMRTRQQKWSNGNLAEESTWTYDEGGLISAKKAGLLMVSEIVYRDETGTITGDQEVTAYAYDGFGRQVGYLVEFDDQASRSYLETVTYDEHGRVFQTFDMTGSDRGVEHVYNARGYQAQLLESFYTNSSNRTVYQDVLSMDALGNVTSQILGDRTVNRVYSTETGQVSQISATNPNALLDYHTLNMTYDLLGNLKSRQRIQYLVNAKERYCYDALNRLTHDIMGSLTGDCSGTAEYLYDAYGNLTEKDGQTYLYQQTGGAGPHAVTSVGGAVYAYDSNGNATSGDGRVFTYSSFGKVTKVERGSEEVEFRYGLDRKRYKREEIVSGAPKTTWYVGNAELVEEGGVSEIRRRIGGEVLVTHQIDSSGAVTGTDEMYHLLDHLGSVIAVFKPGATTLDNLSYDSWGARRLFNTMALHARFSTLVGFTSTVSTAETTRGFTGHEHVDPFGLIHMNGRVYDPGLGRFLQADPFVQFPNNTQSYNRYSYVLNNPLRYTDPSGYFLKELANFAYNVVQMVVAQQWTNPAAWADLLRSGYELVNALQGGGGSLIPGVASGTFGNGAANGTISYFGPPQSPGCAYSPMNCGGTSSSGPGRYDRVIVESILGGTHSEMTGGKFANGAMSVSFLSVVTDIRDRIRMSRDEVDEFFDQPPSLPRAEGDDFASFFWNRMLDGDVREDLLRFFDSLDETERYSITASVVVGRSRTRYTDGYRVDFSASLDGKFKGYVGRGKIRGASASLTVDYNFPLAQSASKTHITSKFSRTTPARGIVGTKTSGTLGSGGANFKAGVGIVLGSSGTAPALGLDQSN